MQGITGALALTFFGTGVFAAAIAGWLAGGHEASDAPNGHGATLPGESALIGVGFLIGIGGIARLILVICRTGVNEERQALRSPPTALVSLGLGFLSGGIAVGFHRQLTGTPNGLDYVTPVSVWFINAGTVLIAVGLVVLALVIVLVRAFAARRSVR